MQCPCTSRLCISRSCCTYLNKKKLKSFNTKLFLFFLDLIHELQREPIKNQQETSDQDSDDESNSSPADSGFKLPRNIKYQRKYVCEVETKSPLCYTMKQLRHGQSEYRMVLLTRPYWVCQRYLDLVPKLNSVSIS